MRDLLAAIAAALKDLPVHDEGNAIGKWSAAYCAALHASDSIDSLLNHDHLSLLETDYVSRFLARYADHCEVTT